MLIGDNRPGKTDEQTRFACAEFPLSKLRHKGTATYPGRRVCRSGKDRGYRAAIRS